MSCSEPSWKEHGQHFQGPCCLPPRDAAELSHRVLCSPLASFALSPVLERPGETGEGSAKVVRDVLQRERRKKLGLFSLVKRAQELFQSFPQLFGEIVRKMVESNFFW